MTLKELKATPAGHLETALISGLSATGHYLYALFIVVFHTLITQEVVWHVGTVRYPVLLLVNPVAAATLSSDMIVQLLMTFLLLLIWVVGFPMLCIWRIAFLNDWISLVQYITQNCQVFYIKIIFKGGRLNIWTPVWSSNLTQQTLALKINIVKANTHLT